MTRSLRHAASTALPLALVSLLVGCPSTESCPDGTLWYPEESRCRAPDDDAGIDAGTDGGTGDTPLDTGPVCEPACAEGEHCSEAGCVECIEDLHCGSGARCFDGVCGVCEEDNECPTDAPVCDAHQCVACEAHSECEGREGAGICHEGACVGCDATSATSCESGLCLGGTDTCEPGAIVDACTACSDDAVCGAGKRCMEMTFGDAAMAYEAGTHCLWRSDAFGAGAPAGACSTMRPYFTARTLTGVGGESAEVCTFATSTCAAQADFRNKPCTLNPEGDALCGVAGVPDAVCRAVDGATNLCTVFCGSDFDCPGGVTCNTGATPRVCRF